MTSAADNSGHREERRPYVSPELTYHENWQIVTGTPTSPAN